MGAVKQIPQQDFILYEDARWLDTITVKNADGTNYDFTGATASLNADATRPATSSNDLTFTTSTEITLSAGSIAIDGAHGLSIGEYHYDFMLTVGGKTILFFKGTIFVRANV